MNRIIITANLHFHFPNSIRVATRNPYAQPPPEPKLGQALAWAYLKNEYSVSVNESGEKVYTPKENSTDSYTYDANWKDKLISYNGQTISYDNSGNPTSYLGHNLTWTMGRQLSSFDNTTYTYNESGIRTSKTVGEDTTEFYLNGTNVIYQTDGTNDIYFFYDRNDEIVGFKYNNNNYFYVKNAMGDITDITDSSGVVVASYTYDPWGKVTSVSGSNIAVANLNPFRYRSYYYDSDIQMYYLQSRYYDPEIGRFINCDDLKYIGYAETINSYNTFAYCENNPVDNSDIDGQLSLWSIREKIKKTFSRAVLAMKNFFAVIGQKLWSEIKRFLGIIKYKDGVLSVHTTIVAIIVDSIITSCSRTAESSILAFGKVLDIFRIKATDKLEAFFMKQMVPVITSGRVEAFLTGVRKTFWKVVTKSTNAVLKYATAYTVDRIYERFDGYDIVSMFTSYGSFFSTMLDVLDGNWDSYIKIWRV